MADFCRQCSEQLFGQDFGDLANIVKEPDMLLHTICEGCGNALVDKDGTCVSAICLEKHGAVVS